MGQSLCCIQVDQSKVAIKENFGKFDDVLEPGCHFMPWCFGSHVAGYLSLRVQQLDVRCETKTKIVNGQRCLECVITCYYATIRNYRERGKRSEGWVYTHPLQDERIAIEMHANTHLKLLSLAP